MLAGNSAFYPGDYESIATQTVGAGGTVSVSFTSIPQTYTHLQIRGTLQLKQTGTSDNWAAIKLNSTNMLYQHGVYGSGSAAGAYSNSLTADNQTNWFVDGPTSGRTNIFAPFITDILDYSNTNKNKTVRTLSGFDANGAGYVQLVSNLYNATTAVSQIDLFSRNGDGFSQYSHFALYGIKAA